MASYILSNANRFYTGAEAAYGQVPAITAQNRFPAVKLTARNELEKAERRDKTGSRTFAGMPAGMRRKTSFDLTTYMTAWNGQGSGPSYGPLFQASLGALRLYSEAASRRPAPARPRWSLRRLMASKQAKASLVLGRSGLSLRS